MSDEQTQIEFPSAGTFLVRRGTGIPTIVTRSCGEYVDIGGGWVHWPAIANDFYRDNPPGEVFTAIEEALPYYGDLMDDEIDEIDE